MNFIHTADLHLGYRQYDLDERFRDLGNSFMDIVKYAISSRAEFLLISGDLFNSRNINAPTFTQAHQVLMLLKEAGIPCIAIEGNHDRPFFKDGMSWLETLEWEGLIKLIKPGAGRYMDNYVDIGSTRIFGMCYAGSMTASIIPRIAEEIKAINEADPPEYTVLMMHLGVEGKVNGNIVGEVPYETLSCLKGIVNYLALGHYHNAYDIDGWVYNPGSPDTCSISEVSGPKGFYHVKDGTPELRSVNPRKFIMVNVNVDGHNNVDSLMRNIESIISRIKVPDKAPIVYVIFRGCLNFDRSHIDIEAIKEMVRSKLNALYVDSRFNLTNDEFCISKLESDSFDRVSIEREVFKKIALSDSMLAGCSDDFVASLSDVKDMAIKGADIKSLDAILRKMFENINNNNASQPLVATPAKKAEEPPAETSARPDVPVIKKIALEDTDDVWDWRHKK